MFKIKNNKVLEFLLSVSLFIISLYAAHLILSPFYGEIKYYIDKNIYRDVYSNTKNTSQISSIENNIKNNTVSISKDIISSGSTKPLSNNTKNNILYIPSIDLSAKVQELEKIEDLHFGVWRRPNTSNPEIGGNTVIVAHRYTDKGGRMENTFYHLPKVKIGEEIYMYFNNKKYTYKVVDIKVVEENDISVEAATSTNNNILTLYTCTPLWSSTHRHVVISELESVSEIN